MKVPCPTTVTSAMLPPSRSEPSCLHVHVDVALERGAVRDGQARGLHVADEPRAREQSTRSVAVTLPVTCPPTRATTPPMSASTTAPASIDDRSFGGELAADRARDDDVFVRRDLALDRDARAR